MTSRLVHERKTAILRINRMVTFLGTPARVVVHVVPDQHGCLCS